MNKPFLISALVIFLLVQIIVGLMFFVTIDRRMARQEAISQQVVPALQQLMQRAAGTSAAKP
jgi:hypothetical protein